MWSRTRSLSLLWLPVRSLFLPLPLSFNRSPFTARSFSLSGCVCERVSALLCLSRAWYVAYTLSANVLYVDINVNAILCVFVSRCSPVGDASRFAVLFPTILLFFLLSTINKIFLSAIVVRVRACSFFANFISFPSFFPQIKSFEIEIIYRLGARSLPIIIAANIAFVARIQLSALSVSFKYINLYVGVFVCLRAWFSFLLMQFSACLDDLIFFCLTISIFIRFLGGSWVTPNGVHSHPDSNKISCVSLLLYEYVGMCEKKYYLFSHRVSNNAMA